MYSFGEKSLEQFNTLHPDLQIILMEVIKYIDITILVGHRNKEDQERAFHEGRSEKHFPDSKHNQFPSIAVDVACYPINWDDLEKFRYLGGFIIAIAHMKGIKIRWGGDWDSDNDFKDQKLIDLPHFELVDPRPLTVAEMKKYKLLD